MKTINIPQDLLNEGPSPSTTIPETLKGIEKETKEYTLHELLDLKNSYPELIMNEAKKILAIKHVTLKEVNEYLVRTDALNYNLVLIKELLSIANGPIYSDMYTKSAYEGTRVTLNKLIATNKAKSKKAVHDGLKVLRDDRQNKCNILDNRLRNYNAKGTVELELLKV